MFNVFVCCVVIKTSIVIKNICLFTKNLYLGIKTVNYEIKNYGAITTE